MHHAQPAVMFHQVTTAIHYTFCVIAFITSGVGGGPDPGGGNIFWIPAMNFSHTLELLCQFSTDQGNQLVIITSERRRRNVVALPLVFHPVYPGQEIKV